MVKPVTPRPYFKARIQDLEKEVSRSRGDIERLHALLHELTLRSTERARALRVQVEDDLRSANPTCEPSACPQPYAEHDREQPSPQPEVPVSVAPEPSNSPLAILDAWTALEVLSPRTFQRPEDLADGDRRAVALLDQGKLPWEGAGEKARPSTRLFYQVVLGSVGFGAAIQQLLSVYSDSRVERPAARGEAILASVIVNREGRLVEKPAAAVSSFAWGFSIARRGDLASLAAWRTQERGIAKELDEVLRDAGSDSDEEEPALNRVTLTRAYDWLLTRLGLPRELSTPPRFAIRVFQPFSRGSEPPEPLLWNSFFLGDLAAARRMFSQGSATANLQLYVGERKPPQPRDLLRDREALDAAVAPSLTPPARCGCYSPSPCFHRCRGEAAAPQSGSLDESLWRAAVAHRGKEGSDSRPVVLPVPGCTPGLDDVRIGGTHVSRSSPGGSWMAFHR